MYVRLNYHKLVHYSMFVTNRQNARFNIDTKLRKLFSDSTYLQFDKQKLLFN